MVRLRLLGALFVSSVLGLVACSEQQVSYSVTAPDGGLSLNLTTDDLGRVHFSIDDVGVPVIGDSRLGFAFANAPSFTEGLSITRAPNPPAIPHGSCLGASDVLSATITMSSLRTDGRQSHNDFAYVFSTRAQAFASNSRKTLTRESF